MTLMGGAAREVSEKCNYKGNRAQGVLNTPVADMTHMATRAPLIYSVN